MPKDDEVKVGPVEEEIREPFAASPITISSATLQGDTIQMTGLTLSGNTDYQTSGGTTGTAQSYQWAWSMNYNDPKKYTARVIQPNARGSIKLATTAWPPNYRIPDNKTNGGVYPPAGSRPSGTEPIRLCPPVSGNGRIMFVTSLAMTVVNYDNNRAGQMSFGLGVSYVNGPNKPMYPFLGVAHALEVLDDSTKPMTFPPNSVTVVEHPLRMDLMDNAFQGDQPIPGWPNWQLQLATDGSHMYPAVTPMCNNFGPVPLTIMDVHGFGYVC